MRVAAWVSSAVLAGFPAAPAVGDGDPAAGAAKSIECIGCHGDRGVSRNDIWPSIACQNEGYLVRTLADFRAGRRPEPIMSSVARQLDDQAIKDLAAFYSSLPECGGEDARSASPE